jgi:hypothetical protein
MLKVGAAAAAFVFVAACSAAPEADYLCPGFTRGDVADAAETAVRARLKNPRAAHFAPSAESKIVENDVCWFTAVGWVEATNGYGAAIRSAYRVDLVRDPADGELGVVQIAID